MWSESRPEKTRQIRGEEPLRIYAAWLWFLLTLFCLRVIGQILVAFLHVSFLPPMEEWYSGLIPYPWLLMSQFFIILVFGKVCIDFTRGHGGFVVPRRALGSGLLTFGSLYFGVMVVRYVIRMSLYPQERWMGGSIPIFFHWILASFILLVGRYQWVRTRPTSEKHSYLAAGASWHTPCPLDLLTFETAFGAAHKTWDQIKK
jgi:hypothetical protein